jgi:hypothetical protein
MSSEKNGAQRGKKTSRLIMAALLGTAVGHVPCLLSTKVFQRASTNAFVEDVPKPRVLQLGYFTLASSFRSKLEFSLFSSKKIYLLPLHETDHMHFLLF